MAFYDYLVEVLMFTWSAYTGTFGQLEHVLLVGVGGGVASPDDDLRHVRLGDVVLSKPEHPRGPIY